MRRLIFVSDTEFWVSHGSAGVCVNYRLLAAYRLAARGDYELCSRFWWDRIYRGILC